MSLQYRCEHCGTLQPWPAPGAGCRGCGKALIAKSTPLQFSLKTFLIIVTLAVFAVWLLAVPAMRKARITQCQARLHRIAQAMHMYHANYGTLPPAYIADASGKPMHSWRVLLLPYLDEVALYERYNFAEPWDGPNNRKLAALMPDVFRCPGEHGQAPNTTSYLVVVGKDAPFEPGKVVTLDEIAHSDGNAWTIMVAECAQSGVHWMEPRDFDITQMNGKINDRSGDQLGLRSHHPGGANAVWCDTSARFVTEGRYRFARVDEELFKTFFTATALDGIAAGHGDF